LGSAPNAVVRWGRVLALIAPHHPKVGPKGGHPPMSLETMLRVYFLRNWYVLSDPMAEGSSMKPSLRRIDCSLATQIGIVTVLRDRASKLVPQAVCFLQDSGLPNEPQRESQAGIAIFRDLAPVAEQARSDGGQIHAAELQELTGMMKSPQVTGLCQNGQCVGGTAWRGHGQSMSGTQLVARRFRRHGRPGAAEFAEGK